MVIFLTIIPVNSNPLNKNPMKQKLDKSNLRKVILEYPNSLEVGAEFAKDVKLELEEKPSSLVVCGMGGSALPGDYLIAYLKRNGLKIPAYVVLDYTLPENIDENALIFISSYSGNTEETISCFEEALEKNLNIVAFSESGKVEKIAKENSIPHVKYQIAFENFQPRYGVTYAFMAMNQVLTNLNMSDKIKNLPKIDPQSYELKGENIAQKVKNKIPVIYASESYGFLAKTWKIKINENSKLPAFWNVFPALNHNEMVGFSKPPHQYFVLMLKDINDHPRNKERLDLTAQLYRERGIGVEIIDIQGESFLEKVLNTSILGDWISYYLALENNQDPTPVDMVEEFKVKIK
jgi:glucose/mannose-6-phosphate isomerase